MARLVIARGDATQREREDAFILLAAEAGHDVVTVPHLYHLPEDAPLWATLAGLARTPPLAVLAWLHPRPLRALLEKHGAWNDGVAVFDLASADVAAFGPRGDGGAVAHHDASPALRWYPLVDAARCVHCGRCQQFCIFGVYALDAGGQVRVAQPERCKPGCPACSRICPESAIMFPLYARDPAIAGAPGMVVQPDAATRRMWYQRTGSACPDCGGAGAWQAGPPGGSCPTCGRATAIAAPRDDLDGLIADLDRRDGRRHG